ncbi:hypothetical protein GQ55_1G252100 [Panicum hallii var. hallii]|uniref:No apical meristem-associated C-terminal domain-containing protein n=1 Tax=Panicum hallii var. hallii TaxID=1504633 RepID=A0A2T7F7A3_9POAL|nr:hypothetical protein GQ55_1G252100 [Panicum hallii var. hallii]
MPRQGFWTNMVEGNDGLPLDDFSKKISVKKIIQVKSACTYLADNGTNPADKLFNCSLINSQRLTCSPPEEQQSPVIRSTPSARPNQKRLKNFNEQEDQLLVSAWLNISTNPIQGANQTKGSFWTGTYDYYHSNKEFTSDRSQSSLLHRWKGILQNVNKFCGTVTRIDGRNQSGITFQDKNILRNQPKWHEKRKQMASQKQLDNKSQKANMDSSPRRSTPINVDSSHNVVPDNAPPETDHHKRPMGKKKAKEALRRGGGEACVEALDHLWAKKRESDAEKEQKKEERYNQSYTLEKRRVKAEEERAKNEAKNLQINEHELEHKENELQQK